jgi:hypothetical protein
MANDSYPNTKEGYYAQFWELFKKEVTGQVIKKME